MIVAGLIVAAMAFPAAVAGEAGTPGSFTISSSSVAPQKAFFDGDEVALRYRFASDGPLDLEIEIRATNDELMRELFVAAATPAEQHLQVWDGLTGAGKVAPDGKYRFLIGERGGTMHPAGTFEFHRFVFPVRGRHGTRGGIGEFGAARNGGRRHKGFDVTAACGTKLIAARGGTVVRRAYNPRLDGNYVVIAGLKANRTYRYSHLPRPTPLRRGDRVRTGQLVGNVGKSGNAASTPCHLHFEIRRGGRPIDPEPALRSWDRYS